MNNISCPHCRTVLQIRAELAGKSVRCPKCQGVLTIPALTPQTPAQQQQQPRPQPQQQRPPQQQAYPQQQQPQQPLPPVQSTDPLNLGGVPQQAPGTHPQQQPYPQQQAAAYPQQQAYPQQTTAPLQQAPTYPGGNYQSPNAQTAQPNRGGKSNKKLFLLLGVGGFVGVLMIGAVVGLLIFQPWVYLNGPEATFNRVKNAMANENYGVLYDHMQNTQREMLTDGTSIMTIGRNAKELEGLEGRARFVKAMEIARKNGAPVQNEKFRNAKVIKTVVNGNEATLTVETDGREEQLYMTKEDGVWKMGKAMPEMPDMPNFPSRFRR